MSYYPPPPTQPQWGPPGPPPGRPPSSGSRVWVAVAVVVALIALAGASAAVTLAVVGGDDASTGTDTAASSSSSSSSSPRPTASSTDSTEPPSESPSESSSSGTSIGDAQEVGDFTLTLTGVDPQADKKIAKANPYNDPPKNGRYVLASWNVTYNGSATGDPTFDIRTMVQGGNGTEYVDYDCGSVVPDNSLSEPPLKPDKSRTFDTCFDVPAKAVDGLRITAKPALGDDDAIRVWNP